MEWWWHLILLTGAFGLGWVFAYHGRKAPEPVAPACKATLTSGGQCIFPEGHDGYHKTTWPLYPHSDSMMSAYCWEDPKCGVHPVRVTYRD